MNGHLHIPGTGRRRSPARLAAPEPGSEFDLFGDRERVLDLNAEILNGTLDLGVAEEDLDGAQIAGTLVDLGCLGAPE